MEFLAPPYRLLSLVLLGYIKSNLSHIDCNRSESIETNDAFHLLETVENVRHPSKRITRQFIVVCDYIALNRRKCAQLGTHSHMIECDTPGDAFA